MSSKPGAGHLSSCKTGSLSKLSCICCGASTVESTKLNSSRLINSSKTCRELLRSSENVPGKRVADVGTGSGILALAAARAGAASVVALDINPNAAKAAAENAHPNGLSKPIMVVGSNLLSALTPRPLFDLIVSSPPSFAGEPRDVADRAWHAGPNYRDIAMLFNQARKRLAFGGCMYVLFSTDSDL